MATVAMPDVFPLLGLPDYVISRFAELLSFENIRNVRNTCLFLKTKLDSKRRIVQAEEAPGLSYQRIQDGFNVLLLPDLVRHRLINCLEAKILNRYKLTCSRTFDDARLVRDGIVIDKFSLGYTEDDPNVFVPTSEMLASKKYLKKLRVESLTVRNIDLHWSQILSLRKTYISINIQTSRSLTVDYFRQLLWPGSKSVTLSAPEVDDLEGLLLELNHLSYIDIQLTSMNYDPVQFLSLVSTWLREKPISVEHFMCSLKKNRITFTNGSIWHIGVSEFRGG